MTDAAENLFEKGCLVQLSISKWQGVKKIDKARLAEMVRDSDHDWVTASKKLVDPESLKPICKNANAARNWLAGISLPFPINGLVFIPKEMISMVDGKLTEYQADFNNTVRDFEWDYDKLRQTAKEYLGELFNELDYPPDIRARFSFAWRFVILSVPNGNTRLLAPEVYEREKEKFIQTMEEARRMAIEALREEFASMVERITERFTDSADGKPKIFKNATVDSFYEYFETFRDRNIFQDSDLSELVEKAQAVLGNRTAEDLRSSSTLRESVRESMSSIEDAMQEAFNRPRRRIVMD